MVEPAVLQRITVRLSAEERDAYIDGEMLPHNSIREVTRGGKPIDIAPMDLLMSEFRRRFSKSSSRADSDGWLAPRLHTTLRLSRAEASDSATWLWLAIRYADYVEWRWGSSGGVTQDRWTGGVNKQTLARLWWGAELFRDGPDYMPVERAFRRQDLINSFLHRPLVRCRSLALGIVDVVAPPGADSPLSSDDVNALARVLNLATAGAPPEAETFLRRDDRDCYARWTTEPPSVTGWDKLPPGPPCQDTTTASKAGGRAVATRAWTFAEAAAARSASLPSQ